MLTGPRRNTTGARGGTDGPWGPVEVTTGNTAIPVLYLFGARTGLSLEPTRNSAYARLGASGPKGPVGPTIGAAGPFLVVSLFGTSVILGSSRNSTGARLRTDAPVGPQRHGPWSGVAICGLDLGQNVSAALSPLTHFFTKTAGDVASGPIRPFHPEPGSAARG